MHHGTNKYAGYPLLPLVWHFTLYESPFLITWPQLSIPLNSRLVAYYRKSRTIPCLRLLSRSPALVLFICMLLLYLIVYGYTSWRRGSSLVPSPYTPPGKKRPGGWSGISWSYSPKMVRTNEIARLATIMSLTTVTFWNPLKYLHFFERVWHKMFWTLVARWQSQSVCKPKKFDLVHQTVSPLERVRSGNMTRREGEELLLWQLHCIVY